MREHEERLLARMRRQETEKSEEEKRQEQLKKNIEEVKKNMKKEEEPKDDNPADGSAIIPTLPDVKMSAAKAIARSARNSRPLDVFQISYCVIRLIKKALFMF